MENKFFVGQKVWSPFWGFGKVESIDFSINSPVRILFENIPNRICFAIDGKLYKDNAAPTLFPADEIPEFYKPYAQDPRIGKWGYFWDDGTISSFGYAKLKDITDGRFDSGYTNYDNFSLEIPEHCK